MLDGGGNIWFVAPVRYSADGITRLSLVRGVYDPARLGHTLEVVLAAGDVINGPNSGRAYTITRLSLSDGEALSPAAMAAGSGRSGTWNGYDPGLLSPPNSATNGGVVVVAEILYDANGDGFFVDPTAPGALSTSPDESYTVLLYVGSVGFALPGCNAADLFTPLGLLNSDDVIAFVNAVQCPKPRGRSVPGRCS